MNTHSINLEPARDKDWFTTDTKQFLKEAGVIWLVGSGWIAVAEITFRFLGLL